MGLLEEVREAQAGKSRGPTCSVQVMYEGLDQQDIKDVEAALVDPRINYQTLSEVLEGKGYFVKADALSRHRRKICACHSPTR